MIMQKLIVFYTMVIAALALSKVVVWYINWNGIN